MTQRHREDPSEEEGRQGSPGDAAGEARDEGGPGGGEPGGGAESRSSGPGRRSGGPEEGPGGRGTHRSWGDALSDVQDTVGEMVGEVLEGVRDVAVGRRFPRMDVFRVEDEGYRVLVDVPGVRREDLEVTTMGGELTVSGRRRPPQLPEGAETLRSERGFGRFHRTLRLPADAREGDVRASLEDGVLVIRIPRAAPDDARRVEID